MNQRIARPFLEKAFGIGEHRRVGFVVWRREADERFSQDGAHACGLGLFSNHVFEVVHVSKCRDAGTNLLGGGQPCAQRTKSSFTFLASAGKMYL